MKFKTLCFATAIMGFILLHGGVHAAPGNPNTGEVPQYVLEGLKAYKQHGYEAAVKIWLKDSPYEAGTQMASQISFFKNIEMLYGRYQSYDIISVIDTGTSNRVYVRMNYERTAGYILFTSIRKNGKWVLGHIDLDRIQKYASR